MSTWRKCENCRYFDNSLCTYLIPELESLFAKTTFKGGSFLKGISITHPVEKGDICPNWDKPKIRE